MAIMVASSTIFIHFEESLGTYLVWKVQLEGKKLLVVSFHHLKVANEVASYVRSFRELRGGIRVATEKSCAPHQISLYTSV